MMSYAESTGCITSHEHRMLKMVRSVYDMLPNGLTCHDVAARCAAVFPEELRHVRGEFNSHEHSWLEIADSRCIIDPYPLVCGNGPILVVTGAGSPWATIYVEDGCGAE